LAEEYKHSSIPTPSKRLVTIAIHEVNPVCGMTAAAHKISWTKRNGFMYIRKRSKNFTVHPCGAQERNMRGGTETPMVSSAFKGIGNCVS